MRSDTSSPLLAFPRPPRVATRQIDPTSPAGPGAPGPGRQEAPSSTAEVTRQRQPMRRSGRRIISRPVILTLSGTGDVIEDAWASVEGARDEGSGNDAASQPLRLDIQPGINERLKELEAGLHQLQTRVERQAKPWRRWLASSAALLPWIVAAGAMGALAWALVS